MYIKPHEAKKGFTLIELLVVIAIIVILMLVALPALNSIFANASVTMAENQLRAVVAQARAVAIRDRCMAGVVRSGQMEINTTGGALVDTRVQTLPGTPDPNY
jgi:prepilin-type N-terminal cleavage/methylation domain-containing protein